MAGGPGVWLTRTSSRRTLKSKTAERLALITTCARVYLHKKGGRAEYPGIQGPWTGCTSATWMSPNAYLTQHEHEHGHRPHLPCLPTPPRRDHAPQSHHVYMAARATDHVAPSQHGAFQPQSPHAAVRRAGARAPLASRRRRARPKRARRH